MHNNEVARVPCSHGTYSLVENETRQLKIRLSIDHTDLSHGQETVAMLTLQSKLRGVHFNEMQVALTTSVIMNE